MKYINIKTLYQTMYAPAMRCILPCLAINEEELQLVQTQVVTSMLKRLGYLLKLPIEVRYGPEELGGLGLVDLCKELGISTLECMHDAIHSHTEAGKLMILNIKCSQIESGVSEPILEHPGIPMCQKPTPVVSNIVDISPVLMEAQREVDLCFDTVLINEMPFLATISKQIKYCTIKWLPSKSKESFKSVLKNFFESIQVQDTTLTCN